jgi:glycosyltransferase involved in cell wall biosynthesis
VKFSIVTPSYRNSEWLKLCIASVADQEGVDHEHIVQDACSDDGTQDWLPQDSRVQAHVEKDDGMYDAINRGIRRSTGELVAYLNCDEQYLPGALKAVHGHFEQNPGADIVAGNFVVVDGKLQYVCHRYAMVPRYPEAWYRFSPSTCAIFCRRRVFDERGLWFNSSFRAVSDAYWLLDSLRSGCRWSVLHGFTSAFADHGDNLILSPNVKHEIDHYFASVPLWVRWTRPVWIAEYRLRMIASGAFWQRPFTYSVFTSASARKRREFTVERPTARWKGRT